MADSINGSRPGAYGMQSKIPFLWASVIIGILGAVFASFTILFLTGDSSRRNVYTEQVSFIAASVPQRPMSAAPQERSGLPVRVKIPGIGVDAAVEYVGIAPDGSMAVPKGPDDVAWFNLGPRPGEAGSAVIAGHEGWKNGIPAVFDDLYKLKPGDRVYSEDGQGAVTAFVVREVRTFGEHEDAWSVFGANDGKPHLNLVTCEGVWNKATKSYSNRTVVFTDKAGE